MRNSGHTPSKRKLESSDKVSESQDKQNCNDTLIDTEDTKSTQSHTEASTFINLPEEVIQNITSFLPSEALCNLALTCHKSRALTLNQKLANPLLEAVIKGNEAKAKQILEYYPHLLIDHSGSAIDHSGRKYTNLTPFQAAIYVCDVKMCQMIIRFFEGHDQLTAQLKAKFPNGIDAYMQNQQQVENVFDFNEIANAIKTASDQEIDIALSKNFAQATNLNTALEEFRRNFDLQAQAELTFNPHHLAEAFRALKNHFILSFDDEISSNPRKELFWRQVIGYVQRYLPAGIAQEFVHGFNDGYNYQPDADIRSFNFIKQLDKQNPFFPLQQGEKLGYDWAADSLGDFTNTCPQGLGWIAEAITRLHQTKISDIHNILKLSTQHRPTP